MAYNIALIRGDGIGPEIIESAVEVLQAVSGKYGPEFKFRDYDAGGCAIDKYGISLPEETVAGCLSSDSVLLGALGGPKWDHLSGEDRPEKALLELRSRLGLFTNLRPAKIYPSLLSACALREDVAVKGFDLVIVRELTGGIYFGKRGRVQTPLGEEAYDTERYNTEEIERIAKIAFETACVRRKKVTSIDKANVLETSRLWRETVQRVSKAYPQVVLEHMLVDNAAMQLIRNPAAFDVVLTSNMFGDILSDEASQITGSIGLLPSASLGGSKRGMYEPIHGSAPDIAGTNRANPIAAVLSAAMMLRYSLGLTAEADAIERAVENVLNSGWRTADIAKANAQPITCTEMTQKVIESL